MAGHNKWSKIKHTKGALDAKRGKLFSKLSKDITIAAKNGGGDIDLNATLRQAINNAKAQNVPKENIDRAVKKGTGELEGVNYEEALYEGYAPGGIAMLIEVVTDNKNRSAADVRHIFSKNNGNFAESGSVSYLFERKGEIQISGQEKTADEILELALEAGADDVESDEDEHILYTSADSLAAVADHLREAGIEPTSQSLTYLPGNSIEVPDASTARQVIRLYEVIEDYDDTQNVYSNFSISDAILEEIAQDDSITA